MSWAAGFCVDDGRLAVHLLKSCGHLEKVPVEALVTAGLSDSGRTCKTVHGANLRSWEETDPAPYFFAFNLVIPEMHRNAHKVYRFQEKGSSIFVPALAWHRAFFRPNARMLPMMYGLHALDRLCFVNPSDGKSVTLMGWASNSEVRQGTFEQRLAWMRLFPSATEMTHSVHRYAMGGEFGLNFPSGSATLFLRGVAVGKDFFANRIELGQFTPNESLLAESSALHGKFFFRAESNRSSDDTSRSVHAAPPILARHDGLISLSDDEWQSLKNLLDGPCCSFMRHDRRLILDGILDKLATQRTWRSLETPGVKWINYANSFRLWMANGKMHTVAAQLNKMRASRLGGRRPPGSPEQVAAEEVVIHELSAQEVQMLTRTFGWSACR